MKKMKTKNFIKSLTITMACILAIGFLLLLVDEGTIAGKMTAVTGSSAASGIISLNTNVWIFIIFIFLILILVLVFFFKKQNLFLKK